MMCVFIDLYDGGEHVEGSSPYNKSKVVPADDALTRSLVAELTSALPGKIGTGVNITAESFYSSQGRIDENFLDNNVGLIAEVTSYYANAKSMEMESFQLLHLARCSTAPIVAAAAAIVVANRCTADVVDGMTLHSLEVSGGRAILEALVKVSV